MRNTWKKAAAFAMALALVAGAAPANVGTGGLFGGAAIVANAATTVTTIDQLKNASGSVVIGADIEYSEYTFWYYDNDVDIDLNGHTITLAQAYFGTFGGNLTIRDSKGDGKILMLEDGIRVPGGNLILDSGTLESNDEYGPIDVYGGTFTMNGGTLTGPQSIWRENGSVIITGGNVNGEFYETGTSLSITGGIFNFDVTSLVNAGVSVTKIGNLWYVGDSAPSIVDLSTATVNLGTDNSVASLTIGDDTITDLSGFDITYGVSDTDHTATAVPSAAGTYYAYVTAKDTNTSYTGTAKSASFDVAAAPTMTNASVTLNDGFGLNFYVDNITDAAGYTVMFDGACDENGTQVALTEKDGKFFATANVNAKDFKENIAATLYKDGVATDVTLTSSVDAYLTALLATDGLDDKTKAMVTSAQLYGLAADEYFNETDNNVAAKLTAYMTAANISDTAINAALTPYAPTFTSDDAKVSMVLNSKIKLRVYSDNGANENGFGKYSEAAGLTPLTLAQPQAIDGFTVSGYTWVYRVLNNTASEAKDVNMAKALFAYMSAAQKLAVVDVASVTLDQSALTLTAGGDTATLTATVLPENATDKTVTWSSDNEAVATVVDGVVTPVAKGTATITATAGGKSATCDVTVKIGVGTVFPIGTADLGDYYYWNHEIDADKLSYKFRNFGNATISVGDNYSHPTLGNYRVISIVSSTAQYIDWEMTQMDPTGPWATWQNQSSYNYFKVDNYDTTPTGIRIASGSGTEDDPFTFEIVFD